MQSTEEELTTVSKKIRGKEYNFDVRVTAHYSTKFFNNGASVSWDKTQADIVTDLDDITITKKQIKLIEKEAITQVYGKIE